MLYNKCSQCLWALSSTSFNQLLMIFSNLNLVANKSIYIMVRLRKFVQWGQCNNNNIIVATPQMLVPHTPQNTLTYQNVTYTLYQLFKITDVDNFFTTATSLTLQTHSYPFLLSNFIKIGSPMKKLYKSVKLMVAKIYKNTCVEVYKIARRLLKKKQDRNSF